MLPDEVNAAKAHPLAKMRSYLLPGGAYPPPKSSAPQDSIVPSLLRAVNAFMFAWMTVNPPLSADGAQQPPESGSPQANRVQRRHAPTRTRPERFSGLVPTVMVAALLVGGLTEDAKAVAPVVVEMEAAAAVAETEAE